MMRKVTTLCVCVSAEMRDRLRDGAEENGLSVSGYINLLLRQGMKMREVIDNGKAGHGDAGPAE